MILFPLTSPRSGLYFSTSRLCLADIHQSFREIRLTEYREHPLPVNCLDLSSSQSNISNPDQLLQILQTLIPEKKRPRSVALSIPDICTRTSVMEFTELPKKKEEQKSLIHWRLEKDLNVSTSTARVSYQIHPVPQPSRPPLTDAPAYRVVVTTINQSIIESYETVCLQAGLVPMSISLASLSVFNLCQSLFDTTSSLLSQKVELLSEQRILIYIADWGFTVLIFLGNNPAFIRIKPMRSSPFSQSSVILTSQEKTGHGTNGLKGQEGQPSPPEPSVLSSNKLVARAIANELIGTMQYFFDAHPAEGPAGSMIPVFLCGSLAPDMVLPEIADIFDKEYSMAGDSEDIGIKTFPIMPRNGSLPSRSLFGLTSWTGHSLPTLGAAIAAS